MSRPVLRLILDVVLTLVVALVLLTLWQVFLGTTFSDAPLEAARLMFLFMDVGLIVWVLLVVIAIVRGRKTAAEPGAGQTFLFALLGTVVNVIVVLIVGFVQGGWAVLFVLFAIEGGVALLVAAAIVLPIVHRVLVKPLTAAAPAA